MSINKTYIGAKCLKIVSTMGYLEPQGSGTPAIFSILILKNDTAKLSSHDPATAFLLAAAFLFGDTFLPEALGAFFRNAPSGHQTIPLEGHDNKLD